MTKNERIIIKKAGCGIIENIRLVNVDTKPYLASEDHCLEIAISEQDIADITTLLDSMDKKENSACEYVFEQLSEKKDHYVNFKNILYNLEIARKDRKKDAVILEEISKNIMIYSRTKNKNDIAMTKKLNEMYEEHKKNPEEFRKEFENNIKKRYYSESIEIIKRTISNFLYSESGVMVIKNAMSDIKDATDVNELKTMAFHVIGAALYNKNIHSDNAKLIKDFYDYDTLFATSVITKTIISEYCTNLVEKLKAETVKTLEIEKVSGRMNEKDLLLMADSDFSVIAKGNGVFDLTIKVFNSKLDKRFDKMQKVLCWDCSNGYVSKCSKIASVGKNNIEDYDFITDGVQVFEDGKIKSLSVNECKNFEKCDDKPKISKEEFNKYKDSLRLYFYDTDDIEVAKRRAKKRR